ncbi:LysE family translocator [Thermodesulfobacteriota bacterium]
MRINSRYTIEEKLRKDQFWTGKITMLTFLTTGILLGLSAGFAPGPLLTLVISETLQHGMRSGIKVALAPILTDLPIIIVTFVLLAQLSDFHEILGLISCLGGLFVLYMGTESLRTKGMNLNQVHDRPKSLRKGILVNAFSPHPYLFWLSVGAPITLKAMDRNLFSAFLFVGSFYCFLVGSKIILAILVGKSKNFMTGNTYINTIRFLGLILILFAGLLFLDGLKMLRVLH